MKRVLIADDKESSREFLRIVLENVDCQVAEAPDGRVALDLALSDLFDLIVLDLHMPGLDGFGVLRELRERAPELRAPIVALTASARPEEKQEALMAGFSEYLTKPISVAELRKHLLRHMGQAG